VDFRKLSRYNHKSFWAWIKTILVPVLGLSAIVITIFAIPLSVGGPAGPDWPFLLIIALVIFSVSIYFLVRSKRRKKSNHQMAQGMYEKIIKHKHEELIKE
jgi:membrane protein implicated in regulation of membrane protease activity